MSNSKDFKGRDLIQMMGEALEHLKWMRAEKQIQMMDEALEHLKALQASQEHTEKKLIDTDEKKDVCVKHIQKYLDRINWMEINPNADRSLGPRKGECICAAFGFFDPMKVEITLGRGEIEWVQPPPEDRDRCVKCPLGPEFMACKKTTGYVRYFNVRTSFGLYPGFNLLKNRMNLLIAKFKEHGLDIDIITSKQRAVGRDRDNTGASPGSLGADFNSSGCAY